VFANNRNRIRWAVVGVSQDEDWTDLFENSSVNRLKGDLSNATTFNPPLFSLVNTFKNRQKWAARKRLRDNEEIKCFLSRGWDFVFFPHRQQPQKILEHGDCKHLKNDDNHWFDCSLRCEKIWRVYFSGKFLIWHRQQKSLFRASGRRPNSFIILLKALVRPCLVLSWYPTFIVGFQDPSANLYLPWPLSGVEKKRKQSKKRSQKVRNPKTQNSPSVSP